MSAPLINVGTRFGSMKVKENPVRLGVPASESNMNDQFQHARFIDPSLEPENLTAKDLAKATSLINFFKTHCHSSNYVFQIRKCKDLACYYCMQHPIRLPDVFNSLSFLPLPLLDTSKEHFLKKSDVYGQLPSGRDRPSLISVASEEAKEIDKERKSALVRGKVRATIACGECSKPRCIYSPSKLSPNQLKEIEDIKASKLYTCGSALLPPDSAYANNIIVREAIVCSSYLEPQYYSSTLVHFPPICYYCGLGEDSLVNDDELKELKEMYAVVYPICFICQSNDKWPHCKQPSNLAKR